MWRHLPVPSWVDIMMVVLGYGLPIGIPLALILFLIFEKVD